MIAPTHITFAEFIYLLLLTTTGIALNGVNAGVIAIASILPDIDTAASTIGKAFPFVSKRIERRFGHRTLTHSAPFIIAMAISFLPLYFTNTDLYVCFLIGYITHPFLDTMTVNGVKLFYPFMSVKCVFPLEVNNPHRYRVQTGGKLDKALATMFAVGCIPTFLIAHQGYERFVRATQQNIEAAVRDYSEFSRDHVVHANISAYDMLTKQPLVGRFEIVGAINPQMLVFKDSSDKIHTLGKDFQADFVAEKILCEKGLPAQLLIKEIDLSNRFLFQITDFLDSTHENYLFGSLTSTDKLNVQDSPTRFVPITGTSTTLKLNYATPADIKNLNLDFIYISKGILTVKSIIRKKPHISQPGISQTDFSGRFTQLSIVLSEKDSLVLLRQEGDSVRKGDVLAVKQSIQFYQEQINLNNTKIQLFEHELASSVAEIDQKILVAGQAIALDSVEHLKNIELSRSGYVSTDIFAASQLKLTKGIGNKASLLSSKTDLMNKINYDVRKLKLANSELSAKLKKAESTSEIRSTVNGILVSVKRITHNNKTQITFIIRQL